MVQAIYRHYVEQKVLLKKKIHTVPQMKTPVTLADGKEYVVEYLTQTFVKNDFDESSNGFEEVWVIDLREAPWARQR